MWSQHPLLSLLQFFHHSCSQRRSFEWVNTSARWATRANVDMFYVNFTLVGPAASFHIRKKWDKCLKNFWSEGGFWISAARNQNEVTPCPEAHLITGIILFRVPQVDSEVEYEISHAQKGSSLFCVKVAMFPIVWLSLTLIDFGRLINIILPFTI